jgi:hypothetical protein
MDSSVFFTWIQLFFRGNRIWQFFSDAFLSGWGAVCNGITARGPWSAEDAPRHINELELLAELFALQSFTALASNIFISLQMYNSAAVCYVNRGAGTRSKSLSLLAGQISSWCETGHLRINAGSSPGRLYVIANKESRTRPDNSDWLLIQAVFSTLIDHW